MNCVHWTHSVGSAYPHGTPLHEQPSQVRGGDSLPSLPTTANPGGVVRAGSGPPGSWVPHALRQRESGHSAAKRWGCLRGSSEWRLLAGTLGCRWRTQAPHDTSAGGLMFLCSGAGRAGTKTICITVEEVVLWVPELDR